MRSGAILRVVAMIVASLVASSTHSQEKAAPVNDDAAAAPAQRIQELRMERIATLEKMVHELATLFKGQRVQYDDVLEGQRLLIDARLEAAETDEQRVKVHETLVALMRTLETNAEAQAQAGRALQTTALKARAKRLEAEIHLEQAKMKLGNDQDLERLQGKWKLKSLKRDGVEVGNQECEYVFRGASMTVVPKEGDVSYYAIKVDASKSPKELDIIATWKDGTNTKTEAIYEIESDSFRWCHVDGKRPRAFLSQKNPAGTISVIRRASD